MLGKLVLLVGLILATGCISPQAAAPTPALTQDLPLVLPDTKPAQLVDQYLIICSDQAKLSMWLAEHMAERLLKISSAESLAEEYSAECQMNGGFHLQSVLQSEATVIRVLVFGITSSVWTRFAFRCDANGKLESVSSMPTFAPLSALPDDLSEANIAHEMNALVQKLGKADLFSGIAVIARGAKIIAAASAGYANKSKKTPFTIMSKFTMGSVGKLFTSVALGQLVDQNKISYDDPVGKFFPKYANKTIREKVTIGMLLSHKGGLADFLDKRKPVMMTKGVNRADEFIALFENDQPIFEPGSGFSYSNAGLALAGAIAEKAAKEPYPDYIRNHIFQPMGMINSDPSNIPHQDVTMVTPYTHFTEQGISKEWNEAEHDIGSPAGGAVSSAEDLVRFADGLRTNKLLSANVLGEIIKSRESHPVRGDYGYALDINEVHGRKIIGHGGGFQGVSVELYIVLDSPYTVVVLSNQDPFAAERVGGYVAAMVAAAWP